MLKCYFRKQKLPIPLLMLKQLPLQPALPGCDLEQVMTLNPQVTSADPADLHDVGVIAQQTLA